MVRAAVGGFIDFSHANPFDRRWYIKRRLLLDAMQTEMEGDYLRCSLSKHLAIMASPRAIDDQVFDSNLALAKEVLTRIFEISICEELEPTDQRKDMARALQGAWEQQFGDINDPNVRARIDAVAAALRAQRMDARTDNDIRVLR